MMMNAKNRISANRDALVVEGHGIRAFTLIELLVVVSIIALLIAILLPVLGRVRGSAKQVQSLSNQRQILVGYTTYQLDNNGRVLYGLTPPTVEGKAITVQAAGRDFGLPVADRYPWRLASYVQDVWEVLHFHAAAPDLPSETDSDSDALLKAYQLSIAPTYGMNSIYVGGHGDGPFEGFINDAYGRTIPNRGKHVVFTVDEARRPSELITFTESQSSLSTDEPEGLYFVSPPHANGQWWEPNGEEINNLKPSNIGGMPQGFFASRAVTGFFDGHAETLAPDELFDMRLWANKAKAEDYDFK